MVRPFSLALERLPVLLCTGCIWFSASAPLALALEPLDPRPITKPAPVGQLVEGEDSREITLGADWKMAWGPQTYLYPRYLADPRRPTLGISAIQTSESEISESGNSRYGIRIGQRFGIARFTSGESEGLGLQLDGEVGFLGHFDRDNSTDNIGWDGLYGIHLSWRGQNGLAARFGVFHDSSHLGDEFIEDNGGTRVDYTREEFLLGLSWELNESWLVYGEYGHAYGLRNEDLMEAGRFQSGLEFKTQPSLWGRRAGWYAAADLSSYEENSWDANVTLQAGLRFAASTSGTLTRLGLEYYDGRSQIGEFFQSDETYLAGGLWLDL